ncbi:HIT domain-containing protein [Candidatus Peregrinibacteria bacterium]|jgi:histidine triad (HIT) family protein|nr:HIT domain-containing protein [Candidatus Peregrinibacteria bacterium]
MCLFCQIINGEQESEKLYEDEKCVVIKDKFPSSSFHVLVIPKNHIDSISTIEETDLEIISHLVWVAKKIAEQNNLKGYKLLWNVNKEGGQVIFHIHLHVMADV